MVEGESSAEARLKSGVPQGSVLGPLLFMIFINDLAENTTSTVRLFADDCVMYRPIRHANNCEALREDLNKLHDWEERWQLRFNATKCNILRATQGKMVMVLCIAMHKDWSLQCHFLVLKSGPPFLTVVERGRFSNLHYD